MAVPPAATAPPRLCPVPAPAATSLLLLAQAASLAATLVVALWRLAVDLPFALLSAAAVGAGVAAPERGGAIFYEGVVRHRRSRPVVHEFRLRAEREKREKRERERERGVLRFDAVLSF